MLILGATGPVDAVLRRPWIDWIHTSQDQGALIRNYVKWDDQPGSVAALPESIYRAWQQTATPPHGPVYVCLDAAVQEQALTDEVPIPDPARFGPAPASRPAAQALREAAAMLARAQRPVILYGRGRRTQEDWDRRVALAERLGAAMLSDLKAGSMVPTDHPLHVGEPFNQLSKPAKAALQDRGRRPEHRLDRPGRRPATGLRPRQCSGGGDPRGRRHPAAQRLGQGAHGVAGDRRAPAGRRGRRGG